MKHRLQRGDEIKAPIGVIIQDGSRACVASCVSGSGQNILHSNEISLCTVGASVGPGVKPLPQLSHRCAGAPAASLAEGQKFKGEVFVAPFLRKVCYLSEQALDYEGIAAQALGTMQHRTGLASPLPHLPHHA